MKPRYFHLRGLGPTMHTYRLRGGLYGLVLGTCGVKEYGGHKSGNYQFDDSHIHKISKKR